MYTKEEKEIAKNIVSNKAMVEFMTKVFLGTEDRLTEEVINSKTDKELGEITRANSMADRKVKSRFAVIKNLSVEAGDGKPNVVPK